MKFLKMMVWGLCLSVLLSACGPADQQVNSEEKSLTVSAAISLADALEELKPLFEEKYQAELTFNLGSSGKLAQQIQNGAPTDVFISANQDWMTRLEAADEILPESREDVTGNRIVMIVPKSSDINISSIDQLGKQIDSEQIAIGNPDTVPAGKYTYDALEKLDILDDLQSQFVIAKDVRQVLTYVETENAAVGFVYESDAQSSNKIETLLTVDDQLHAPIVYPAAVLEASKDKTLAGEFIDFLMTDQAQKILAAHGFRK